jgi:hypothetical protein
MHENHRSLFVVLPRRSSTFALGVGAALALATSVLACGGSPPGRLDPNGDDAGPAPVEDAGPSPAQDAGPRPSADSGPPPPPADAGPAPTVDSGPTACPISFSNSACETCFKTSCATSCGDCADDVACNGALSCITNCSTEACVDDCVEGLSASSQALLGAIFSDPQGCIDTSCRSECTTPASNGDPCVVGADCASGTCAGDGVHTGWCTMSGCTSNVQCGIDTAGELVWCVESSGGTDVCFPGCQSNTDCAAFYCSDTGGAATCKPVTAVNGGDGMVCAC